MSCLGGGAGTAPTGTTHSLLPDIFKFGASRRGKHRLHLHIALLGKQKPKNELGLALNHSTRLGGRGGMGCKPAQGPPTCPFPAPSAFASQWSVSVLGTVAGVCAQNHTSTSTPWGRRWHGEICGSINSPARFLSLHLFMNSELLGSRETAWKKAIRA